MPPRRTTRQSTASDDSASAPTLQTVTRTRRARIAPRVSVASSLQDDNSQSEGSEGEVEQNESADDSILDEELDAEDEPLNKRSNPSGVGSSTQAKRNAKANDKTSQKVTEVSRPTTGRTTRRQAESSNLQDDVGHGRRRSARLSATPVPETSKIIPRATRAKKQVVLSDAEDEEGNSVDELGHDDSGDVTIQPDEPTISGRTAMALEDDEEDLVEMSLRPSQARSETPTSAMTGHTAGRSSNRAREPLGMSLRQNETVEAKLEPAVEKDPKKRLVIRKMALVNFKSYRGRQEIGPFHKAS
jgi:structural maintenance of chromosome 4